MQHDEYEGPLGQVFAVVDNPYCCWDFDHKARTLEFLDGIDPDYFRTISSILAERLETDEAFAVSIALRVTYQQGLEALISLLGALAQAPLVIAAWIAKCSTGDLMEVARRLRDSRPLLTQAGRRPISFDDLSQAVHRFTWTDETGDNSTAARFGRLWRRLATEFVDEVARAEYNALKHGHRVQAGGFTLAIGTEETPGVAAPAEAMRSMGGSRFGSTFFVAERVGTSKLHIRMRRTSINWSPEALAKRLHLVSMSVSNVVGALRCELGVDPSTVRFLRPDPLTAFDDVWAQEPAARSFNIDSVIQIDPSDERPRDVLLEHLERRGS